MLVPILVGHFDSQRRKPDHISDRLTANRAALEKFTALQYRLFLPKLDRAPEKIQKGFFVFGQSPTQPTEGIILTLAIVVAALRLTQLVAAAKHGDTL